MDLQEADECCNVLHCEVPCLDQCIDNGPLGKVGEVLHTPMRRCRRL